MTTTEFTTAGRAIAVRTDDELAAIEARPPAGVPAVGIGEAADVLAVHARHADELARLVEDWQAANAGYARVLTRALGELHVALDQAAHDLTSTDRDGGTL